MGLGPPVIALYHQLKTLGVFEKVEDVVELGSQDVWCPHKNMMRDLFRVFGREIPPDHLIDAFANWQGSARDLYENLGMRYVCVDVDARYGALTLDMNFDEVPPDHKNRYDLTTNHGTSEHLLNQYNVFKMMHDLTKPGGFMLHAVPFTVHLEHGFFNYQPKFFDALARCNSYKTFGVWVGPDWQLSSFVPWHPSLLDYLVLSPKTTHLLVVLQQKVSPNEFDVPIHGCYEDPEQNHPRARYCMVVDGEYYDGGRSRYVTNGPRPMSSAMFSPDRQSLVSSMAEPLLATAQSFPSPLISKTGELNKKRGDEQVKEEEESNIGLGPLVITLYRQLKALGMVEGVREVVELGSQKVWCPKKNMMRDLFRVFGQEEPLEDDLDVFANQKGTARDLYERLGMNYNCVDRDSPCSSLRLNFDFESIPVEHRNRYDLTTNHGTSEYWFNQYNVFRMLHDLTKPGGLILHTVPFTVQLEHGFFNYQPNLFDALAQYNSYRTLGLWIGVDGQAPSFIPWQPSLLDYLEFTPRTKHLLVVLFQKMYGCEFCLPFQGCYEDMIPESSLARYRMVIDGEYYDGAYSRRMKRQQGIEPVPTPTYSSIQLSNILARDLVLELRRRLKHRIHCFLRGNLKDALTLPQKGSRG